MIGAYVAPLRADAPQQKAPACQLRFRDDAAAHALSQYQNKVVLVDFWASWCGPCLESFPFLNRLKQTYADRGLEVIGINLDENPADAASFLAQNAAEFSVALGDNTECAKAFAVQAMPSSYIIDRQGIIRLQTLGFRASETDQVLQLLEQLLAE